MSGSILILAGRRAGAIDPLAAAYGVADKCLVPVAGRPMIAHVLESAAASSARPSSARISAAGCSPATMPTL